MWVQVLEYLENSESAADVGRRHGGAERTKAGIRSVTVSQQEVVTQTQQKSRAPKTGKWTPPALASPPPLDNPYLELSMELSLLSLTKVCSCVSRRVRDAADIGVNYGLEFEGSAGRRAATASRC